MGPPEGQKRGGGGLACEERAVFTPFNHEMYAHLQPLLTSGPTERLLIRSSCEHTRMSHMAFYSWQPLLKGGLSLGIPVRSGCGSIHVTCLKGGAKPPPLFKHTTCVNSHPVLRSVPSVPMHLDLISGSEVSGPASIPNSKIAMNRGRMIGIGSWPTQSCCQSLVFFAIFRLLFTIKVNEKLFELLFCLSSIVFIPG